MQNIISKSLIASAFVLLISTFSYAATIPPSQVQDEATRNYDIQEKERLERERIQRQQTIEKKKEIEIPEIEKPEVQKPETAQCVKINKIIVDGAEIFTTSKQDKLFAPYIQKCINPAELNNIVKDITNWYFNKGYVTTRVYIPQQNILSGNLIFKVIEGRVERVKQNDDKWRDKMEVYTAFPMKKNKKLNIRDMEQGIDQLNKLPSNNAQANIVPGENPGFSVIDVKNKQEDKLRGYVDVSNSLNVQGQPKLNARVEKDNLFHLNDQIQYNYGTGLVKSNDNVSRNHGISFVMPFGYWTIKTSYYYFKSLTNLNLAGNTYPYDNYTNNINLGADYVLYRWKTAILTLVTNLAYKDRSAYFSHQYLETLSRRTGNVELGLDFTNKFTSGFYNFRFMIVQGTKWFGAKHDDPALDGPQYPKAQFRKYTLDGSMCYYFGRMKYCTNGRAQVAQNTLYSEEQIGIGDRYTVRGFNKGFYIGDSGFYARNELSLPFYYQGQNNFVRAIWSPELFVGLDIGFDYKKGGNALYNNMNNVWLSGFAFGVRNNARWFNFSLTAAIPIMQPRFIYALEGKNIEIYANITVKCL